jgi:adenylate cyclase
MKKNAPVWLSAIPLILLATLFQLTFDLGEQGKLESPFLRERIYPIAQSVNGALTNIKFRVRGPRAPNDKVIVVEADDQAVATFGRWPWHREVYAQLFHAIFSLGAKDLALDVAYSEPEERIPVEIYEAFKSDPKTTDRLKAAEGDPLLAEVIRNYRERIVLGYASEIECQPKYALKEDCPVNDPEITRDVDQALSSFALKTSLPFGPEQAQASPFTFFIRVFSNIPAFRDAALHSGYFGAHPDNDGFIRRYSLFSYANGRIYPSLALALAQAARKDEVKVDFSADGLIERAYFSKSPTDNIPVTPLGYVNLNFRGPSRTFRYISVIDVFKAFDSRDPAMLEVFKEAHVFFGVSAIGIYDMRAFPFDSNTPGVEGHATAFDNLMSNDELKSASAINLKWLPIALLWICGLLFAFTFSRLQAIPSLAVFLAFMAGFGLFDLKVLFANNINLATAFLLLETLAIFALILSIRYILEERNKKFVRDAFSKYLAPQVVDLVLEDPTKLTVGGERKEMTILFSDLRGFTSFSENMDPKTLTQFLNEYLSEMTDIVFENKGTLDKYIGDAVMAFWGAPLDQPDHAALAWSAAIQMNKRLAEIAPDFKARFGIDVSAGIGINSGVVSVGNMGSKRIFEYTVIGDHVNLASRLESLTRLYGCDLLTTRESFELIPEAERRSFHVRLLDSVKVKGKKNAVDVITMSDTPFPEEVLNGFDQGKTMFRERKWDEAKACFAAANEASLRLTGKADGPSEMYLERCDDFSETPPPEDWDGSIEMRKK